MVNEKQRSYFQEWVAGWNDRDLQRLMAPFAEGAVYRDPVIGESATGNDIEQYFAKTIKGFPDLGFDGRVFHTQADGVLINQWTGSGTHAGTYFGLPPTGRSVTIEGVSIFTISDDGIVRVTSYFDQSAVKEQLGLKFPELIGHIPKLLRRTLTRGRG